MPNAKDDIDVTSLHTYLINHETALHLPPSTSLTLKQFNFGQSNPTYLVSCPPSSFQFVLRRKPFRVIDRTAHAIEREYAILKHIKTGHCPVGFEVPVPTPYLLCEVRLERSEVTASATASRSSRILLQHNN